MPGLGVVFSLLSAASFGINEAMTRRGMQGASASQGLYITVTFGVPAFLLAAIVTGQFGQAAGVISPMGLVWLGAAGIVHFLGGRYCNYRSIGAIGANRSQPLRSTALLYSVLFAVIILHEELTVGRAISVALLTAGALMMVERRSNASAPGATAATLAAASGGAAVAVAPAQQTGTWVRLVEGYGFGLMAGVMYGISAILIKLGLEGTNLGLFGGFISYLAATAVLLSTLWLPGRIAYIRTMKSEHARWFLGSGTFVFLAQMFRYLALGIEDVILVSSLGQLNGIFTLFFSLTVNRHLESFRPQVVIGIILSVLGGLAQMPGLDKMLFGGA
jgi:drug/metabolite transporter (DMT)-like permease